MKIKMPSKEIRGRFLLIYELEGCQKAVDFLTKYYGVRRMRIVLDGRRVGNGDIAVDLSLRTELGAGDGF